MADLGNKSVEDTGPSALSNHPQDSLGSPWNLASGPGIYATTESVKQSELFHDGLQHDIRPIVIQPLPEEYSPVKNIDSGNDMRNHIVEPQASDLMKRKSDFVMNIVPHILANNARFKGAKWENITILNEIPLQKGRTECRVHFSTQHKPANLIITENIDKSIGVVISDDISMSGPDKMGLVSYVSPKVCASGNSNATPTTPYRSLKMLLEAPVRTHASIATSTKDPHSHDILKCPVESSAQKRPSHGIHQCQKCYQCFQKEEMLSSHSNVCHGALSNMNSSRNPDVSHCPRCNSLYANRAIVQFYFISSHGKSLFGACVRCLQKSKTFEELSNDGKNISIELTNTKYGVFKVYQCLTCNVQYDSPGGFSALKVHLQNHTKSIIPSVSITCRRLQKKEIQKKDITQLITKTLSLNQCPNCRRCFSSPSELKLHTNSKHDYTIHQCQICGKWSEKEEWLKAHSAVCAPQKKGNSPKKDHVQLPSQQVIPASLKPHTISKHGANVHQKVVNPTVNPSTIMRYSPLNQCPNCRRLFTSPSELQLHTNSKHDYTIHQCQICGQWSRKEEWLKAHSAICSSQKENSQKKGKDELKLEMSEYESAAISESKPIINQEIFNMAQELEIKP